jgi:hypothetical protein
VSAATSERPAAYEAWGVEGRKPALLGVGATKGDCDRILRLHEGAGLVVRSGVVIAVKTGTVPAAKASLQHAAFAAYRESGDLPAPTETDRQRERVERMEAERERQRAALRLVAPLPEERADEGDEESDEADEEPAGAADDRDEPEGDEDDETDQDDTDDTSEDTVDRRAPTTSTYAEAASATPAVSLVAAAATESGDHGCTALGCKSPRDATRSTTRPEVADLCAEHRMLARRIQHNRDVTLAAAAAELRERGYVPIAPQAAAARAAPRRAAPAGCPVPGCGKPSAPAQARTAPELVDLCTRHRTRVRDLLGKVPGYTPALARERIITGQRPAGMAPALTHAESGARGGKARTKILRPAKAETVRRVPAVPVVPAPAPVLAALAPAGSPLGERVAVVRRLVACEARAGGVENVERLVELADRYGADEIVALVNAAYGGPA